MHGWTRRIALAIAAVAVVPAAAAQAAAAPAPAPLDVQITAPATRAALLASGELQVGLTASAPLSVRLDARRDGDRLTGGRGLSFRAPGTRTVTLDLSRKGRDVAARCGVLTVAVRARVTIPRWTGNGRHRHAEHLTVTAQRTLTGDCAPPAHVDLTDADRCDFLDAVPTAPPGGTSPAAQCLLPFPNDYFTVADATTRHRAPRDFDLGSMPRTSPGEPIDPTDWNRADGFSPGSLIVTQVPGLDTPQAFATPASSRSTDIAQASTRTSRRRHRRRHRRAPARSGPSSTRPPRPRGNRAAHPARRRTCSRAHRYIVALRDLKAPTARRCRRRRRFARLPRPPDAPTQPRSRPAARTWRTSSATLARAGIARSDLYLAWDFTVASERAWPERMLAIRDDAFGQLGDTNLADLHASRARAPPFTSPGHRHAGRPDGTGPRDRRRPRAAPRHDAGKDSEIAADVTGTMTVPCYLDQPGCAPGARFHFASARRPASADPDPRQHHTARLRLPSRARRSTGGGDRQPRRRSTATACSAARSEVNQGQLQDMAFEHELDVLRDRRGPAWPTEDVPNVARILHDLSNFPTARRPRPAGDAQLPLPRPGDVHPRASRPTPASRTAAGTPVIDTARRCTTTATARAASSAAR